MNPDVLFFLFLLLAFISLLAVGRRQNKPSKKPAPRPSDLSFEASDELGVPVETRPRPAFAVELPRYYHDVRLTLLVRDPEWLYAYWEIAPDRWEAIRHSYGDLATYDNICLRILELSDPRSHFDIRVKSLVGDWHIHVGKPNTPYYGILGLLTPSGFLPITVSNAVMTPRNDISTLGDEEWMMVNDYEQRIIERIGAIPFDATSPSFYDFEPGWKGD
ncbi:MAG TPA: DUF4912 domain-containing protein [Syntrophothermus lipocalidus]|uniref:DUF4912 domain-containing protein n=1 Tax=Syntrophothermus lipocalidus (strain DSM 12680 / TGB-C1) TaxID=643648 RepID=D7CL45_SYNLT|nr:DUF4912 domain-containing protein [Syntrophothermus lipocalidus]ADI01430.1 conserved hypothetical protein [Syntrophothermus lipocalidus DSM 12680]HHV76069.1 DUF4912 domain-containing protein [Syntrophothermus lipocalidus]